LILKLKSITSIDSALTVLYRDQRLIAVSKPSGMIVHRGWGRDAITVADIVRDQLIGAPVHAIHRLDRGTSGVLLFALDPDAARDLQAEFEAGRVIKRYFALVRGPMLESCVLDHPVPQREGGDRVPAVTEFRPLAHSGRWTLVEACPRTGRLHQIRRHLKHLSHHVVGDVRYGKGDVNRFFRENYDLNRLALHAFALELKYPDGNQLLLQADLPPDLFHALEKLGLWPVAQLPPQGS
jgi:tRNA pseudouridine65 synthase